MNDAGRKRIDVSSEVHALLEGEARRRTVPIRDLVDQAVTEMLDRRAQADLSIRQQRERGHADRIETLTAQLADLGRRFTALLQETKAVPAALTRGFDEMKGTIGKTGGTGHLRDMIAAFEKRFLGQLEGAQGGIATAVADLAKAVDGRGDRIERLIAEIRRGQGRGRTIFGIGAAFALALVLLLGLLHPDTRPTRWVAVRLAGATRPADAAWILAGDGRTSGLLMAETHALLGNQQFRERYTECVARAKTAKAAFSCRLTFPPVVSRNP